MDKKYETIFFDLDHTLWNYEKNAAVTLQGLYQKYELSDYGIANVDHFVKVFSEVNEMLWSKFHAGTIDKFYLRNERFRIAFSESGATMPLVDDELLFRINKDFLSECPKKPYLIEGAKEILDYLHPKYKLHIITNGFEETQSIKMQHAGILDYFGLVITSEKAGHKKPFPGIYKYALKHAKAALDSSIMIGDNLGIDVKGAKDYGMDQVYYNPQGLKHDLLINHDIKYLSELGDIL